MSRGEYVEIDGRPAVRFVRDYPHPVERVWAAVSDPDELRHWFPSKVAIEPRVGGSMSFTEDEYAPDATGTVLSYEPPHRIAFTWGPDEIHIELTADGASGCRMTFVNVLDERNAAARNASGWSVCLAVLERHLAGEQVPGPNQPGAPQPPSESYDDYVAAGLPSGAWMPSADDPPN